MFLEQRSALYNVLVYSRIQTTPALQTKTFPRAGLCQVHTRVVWSQSDPQRRHEGNGYRKSLETCLRWAQILVDSEAEGLRKQVVARLSSNPFSVPIWNEPVNLA